MKRVTAIVTFFVLIISIFFIKMQAASYSPEKVLIKAFDSSGAAMVGSELYLRGRMDISGSGVAVQGRDLIEDIMESLGSKATERDYKILDNDYSRGIELDSTLSGGSSLHAGVIDDKGSQPGPAYVSVSLESSPGTRNLTESRAALEKVMKVHGIKAVFNSCITGAFNGKAENKELNEACARIFASVDARKVEGIREGGLISVSAFSNAIRESVKDNGSRVNLNLAFRYNSYEKKTYIWLATPVITTEY